ncbi:hypothetical protein J8F10_12010 [Gemmata sp. G18]|uniref:Uncharacterized protein n=1 Tax=Gemmata palustris TaxID=2822762 RepID=A0ABS5BQT6_9BACT|nr:hypothetical protein [Gemmata palustris]MBP3956010.1 hypothetical protein [Gemmata palustris]
MSNRHLPAARTRSPPVAARAGDRVREPIKYKTATADNVAAALQKQIDAGKVKLKFVDDHGYLPATGPTSPSGCGESSAVVRAE